MRFLGAFTAFLSLAAASPFLESDDVLDDFELELEPRRLHHHKHPKCSSAAHVVVVSQFTVPKHGNGALDQLVGYLRQYIPGTDNYSVPYPKYKNQPTQLVKTAKVGTKHVRRYIRWYSDGCPDVPLIVVSFSEGSLIAMNGLCGRSHVGSPDEAPLPAKYGPRVIAVTAWGDPSYVSGQSWDTGSCTSGYGENPRQTPSNCDEFSTGMKSWCVEADPVCCRGDDGSQHLIYPTEYLQDTFNWIYGRWQAWSQANQK